MARMGPYVQQDHEPSGGIGPAGPKPQLGHTPSGGSVPPLAARLAWQRVTFSSCNPQKNKRHVLTTTQWHRKVAFVWN